MLYDPAVSLLRFEIEPDTKLNPTSAVNAAGSYSIDRSLFDQSYYLEGGEPDGPSYGGYSMNFIRSCYGSTPVPGLYVKNPLSLRHVLNGLALLVQAFK